MGIKLPEGCMHCQRSLHTVQLQVHTYQNIHFLCQLINRLILCCSILYITIHITHFVNALIIQNHLTYKGSKAQITIWKGLLVITTKQLTYTHPVWYLYLYLFVKDHSTCKHKLAIFWYLVTDLGHLACALSSDNIKL